MILYEFLNEIRLNGKIGRSRAYVSFQSAWAWGSASFAGPERVKVTSTRYCLISQNRQVVENWRSTSRTEIRTTDLAALEITMDHQDDNHEVQRPTAWPVQVRNKIDFVKKKTQNISAPPKKRKHSNEYLKYGFSVTSDEDCPKPLCIVCGEIL
ncbi:hypothetical protein AVEN_218959-1 [Araneus ventricosus]|uniref:Uncharacterized protein n=1 Tax=Araneus ventricosus TaxID=182803 RepID=A0A4Y2CDE4_ARAVE|nr:hypothetical protein AVEN_218959-1 [Araneus ventricosus]